MTGFLNEGWERVLKHGDGNQPMKDTRPVKSYEIVNDMHRKYQALVKIFKEKMGKKEAEEEAKKTLGL